MRTTVDRPEQHTVKLTIEVDPEEFAKDLDKAYRSIANQVKIPGFRKGKVPRRILDAQVGQDVVMEEFLSSAVPAYFREAVREEDLAPIAEPEIDLEQAEDGKPLIFTATVEVRPRLELTDYRGVRIDKPDTSVTEQEVDDWVERLRERFAELEPAERAATSDDYVVMDVRGTLAGEEVEQLTRSDYLHRVGSGEFGPVLDGELPGTKAHDLKERESLGILRDRVVDALVTRTHVDLPETLIDHETEHRVSEATARAERSGLTLAQVLESQGWDEDRFRSDARDHAVRAITADLVLEAVARAEKIEVTADEIGAEINALARAYQRDPKEFAKQLDRSGQIVTLASDIIRTKALDLLVEHADIQTEASPTDGEGEHVAQARTEPEPDQP